MAARYWVPGGNSNWSSTGNWSTTSGGASGSAAPTLIDDAFFDANSFTTPNKQVKIDAAAVCRNLDFTGAINSPWFTWTSSFDLTLHGDLTIPAATTVKFGAASSTNNSLIFGGTGGIQYIDTNSNVIPAKIEKTGTSQLQLLSALVTKAPIDIGSAGNNSVQTNNFNITINTTANATHFSVGSGVTGGTFDLGTSTLSITSNQAVTLITFASNLTTVMDEASIVIKCSASSGKTYAFNSYTYGSISISTNQSNTTDVISGSFTATNLNIENDQDSQGQVSGTVTITNLTLTSNNSAGSPGIIFSGNNNYFGTVYCKHSNELKINGINSYIGSLTLDILAEVDYSASSGNHWIDSFTSLATSTGTRCILRGTTGVVIKSAIQVIEADYCNVIDWFPHAYTVWYVGDNSTYGAQVSDTVMLQSKPSYTKEKQVSYRVFSQIGAIPLGELKNVTSDFAVANEINTAGGVITISIKEDAAAAADNALYAIDNHIEVYVRDRQVPAGQILFQGYITDVGYDYANDIINLTVSNYGQELQKNLIQSSDVAFFTEATSANVTAISVVPTFPNAYIVDSFTTGVGTTNVHSLAIDLATLNGYSPAQVRVKVFNTRADAENITLDNSIGSSSIREVGNSAKQTIKFVFPSSITLSASTEYFFRIELTALNNGYAFLYIYGDTSAGANQGMTERDCNDSVFAFLSNTAYTALVAYSNDEATEVTFNSTEISDILKTLIDNYRDYGGNILYSAGSIEDTGVTITYTFNTDSISAGIEALRRAAPDGWYWKVDPKTNLITFKPERDVASIDHFIPKGKAVGRLILNKKGGDVVNTVYFTGGDTGGGVNLYKKYVDETSYGQYGRRAEVITDGRVTVAATAASMSEAVLDRYSQPYFNIEATIVDESKGVSTTGYDIETVAIGQNVLFTNYDDSALYDGGIFDTDVWGTGANSVANQVLQVVRLEYELDKINIVLNIPNTSIFRNIRDVTRATAVLETADNPSAPT